MEADGTLTQIQRIRTIDRSTVGGASNRNVPRLFWSVMIIVAAHYGHLFWPIGCICLSPLVWIWRSPLASHSVIRISVEAVVLGFAASWISTGFVRDAVADWGYIVQAIACLVFGLHFVAIAVSIHLVRHWPILFAALATSIAATASEVFQAWLGITWSVKNLAMITVTTPIAQWASLVTPFGVSGILYFVNFLFASEASDRQRIRWLGPITATFVTSAVWGGGVLLASSVVTRPCPFSVMLVQSHLQDTHGVPWRPWVPLDRLTRLSLEEQGAVDLIVWPEAALSNSNYSGGDEELNDSTNQMTIQQFSKNLQPVYGTNCLVGVPMAKVGSKQQYGLEVQSLSFFNCACLVSSPTQRIYHEKRVLVPIKEYEPDCLQLPWIRKWLPRSLQLTSPFTPGERFQTLRFVDLSGQRRAIAVSVCYESFFPWLPQYNTESSVDAIIHILYDGNSVDHPQLLQHQIDACRFRAIETRKWNLVCSTWAGTAIIDPKGQIVRQLPPVAGVLRTDM